MSFDLFVIQSWDGNDTVYGPDTWRLAVGRGPSLIHTTFSNNSTSTDSFRRAFPGTYPGGNYPGTTGAVERGTLGYPSNAGYGGVGDSVYHLSATFTHPESAVTINFRGGRTLADGDITDESWGVDDVTVSVG